MRSYRLYRVGQMGTIADNKAILHLMGPNDVFLLFLGVLFGFLLTPAFREGTPHWVSEDAKLADSETSPTKSWLKIGVVVVCFGLFILRMLLTFQRVYVEEVLAIRGVGIQIVSYGVFNNVKRIKFIDWKMIRSLVIHDSFFRYRPIFFLSSSIENESERLVYFDSFM
ncbi:phosphatidylinositol glycan, class H, partial [Angomonas deanei]